MGIPIGASDKSFPSNLLNNKGLISLVRTKNTGIAYKDNLCIFRCAALHLGYTTTCLEEKANQLFQNMLRKRQLVHINSKEFSCVN